MTRLFSALALAVLAFLPAACGGEGEVTSDELPRTVLQRSDLPDGFEQFAEGRLIALEQPLGDDGWKARYRRLDPEAAGPLVVESRVDRYESAEAARAGLAAYRERFEEAAAGEDASLVEVSLGQEAEALAVRRPGLRAVRFYEIAWREANVTGFVAANGFEEATTLESVLELARRQQRRIEDAASS